MRFTWVTSNEKELSAVRPLLSLGKVCADPHYCDLPRRGSGKPLYRCSPILHGP